MKKYFCQQYINLKIFKIYDKSVLPVEDFIEFLRQNLQDGGKQYSSGQHKIGTINKNVPRKITGKISVIFQGIVVYTANRINKYAI